MGRGAVQEMNDFLSDLGDWTNEVQGKDDALKQGKAVHGAVPAAAAPAPAPAPRGRVRNTVKEPPTTGGGGGGKSASAKREKARAAEVEAKASASAAGHTYDYFRDKWDKFDVDAALEDVDNDSEDEGATKRPPAPGGSILRRARPRDSHRRRTARERHPSQGAHPSRPRPIAPPPTGRVGASGAERIRHLGRARFVSGRQPLLRAVCMD